VAASGASSDTSFELGKAKRHDQLGRVEQVRQNLEKAKQRVYGREKALRSHDVHPGLRISGKRSLFFGGTALPRRSSSFSAASCFRLEHRAPLNAGMLKWLYCEVHDAFWTA
jgi:hypothetical protein